MRAKTFLASLALLAIAGCAAPAETIQQQADAARPLAPFHAEDTWWVEPSTSEMSTHEILLNLSAGLTRLEIEVVARTTYMVDLPKTSAQAHVSLLDPSGELVQEAWLSTLDASEATLLVEAPRGGVWTLLLEAYGGSGNGMGDSLSWVADGSA